MLRLTCCTASAMRGDGAGQHGRSFISYFALSYKGRTVLYTDSYMFRDMIHHLLNQRMDNSSLYLKHFGFNIDKY